MSETRRVRLKGLPFNRMIPNILTLLALCAGMTAIRFGLQERWEHAVLAILVAAVLDGLDGRIARILKGASKFGAELDSLSDFVCFGVAPAVLLYLWTLQGAGQIGWMLSLLFSVCCALRLARFNTNLDSPPLPWSRNFFTGVPAPAGGGLALMPMALTFQFGDGIFREPAVVGSLIFVIALLMVSRVPTFSGKRISVEQRWILPTMLLVSLLAAALVSAPWMTLWLVALLYVCSFPFSIRSFNRQKAEAEQSSTEPLSGQQNG